MKKGVFFRAKFLKLRGCSTNRIPGFFLDLPFTPLYNIRHGSQYNGILLSSHAQYRNRPELGSTFQQLSFNRVYATHQVARRVFEHVLHRSTNPYPLVLRRALKFIQA